MANRKRNRRPTSRRKPTNQYLPQTGNFYEPTRATRGRRKGLVIKKQPKISTLFLCLSLLALCFLMSKVIG